MVHRKRPTANDTREQRLRLNVQRRQARRRDMQRMWEGRVGDNEEGPNWDFAFDDWIYPQTPPPSPPSTRTRLHDTERSDSEPATTASSLPAGTATSCTPVRSSSPVSSSAPAVTPRCTTPSCSPQTAAGSSSHPPTTTAQPLRPHTPPHSPPPWQPLYTAVPESPPSSSTMRLVDYLIHAYSVYAAIAAEQQHDEGCEDFLYEFEDPSHD